MARRRRRDPRPLPERLAATALLATCVLVAGCGSANRPREPPARRLCSKTQAAAASALRSHIRVRILSAQPSYIQCRLAGGGLVLAVEAQTSDQAWVEFDTEQSHYAQVFGPSSVHNKNEQPQNVTGVGPQAFWVPAQRELVTTNAQEGATGTYVTVSVTHHRRGAGSSLSVASAVARAALAASPRAR
jgi:hypothetical protein